MAIRIALLVSVLLVGWACGGGDPGPGEDRTGKTRALETGANILQGREPLDQIGIYLNGFHVAKQDPSMQMEAHHFCNQVNEDFMQCVLFDGSTADARLMGIEYIVSEKLYEQLPAEERAYWHPHNFEILSGQLHMPGLPAEVEKAALTDKINSYGKTWHTWMTGMWQGEDHQLPLGPPLLQWSLNHDGEDLPGMVAGRDIREGFDTAEARSQRRDLAERARPQAGVDALSGQFPRELSPIPGVTDNGDEASVPVPALILRPDSPAKQP